MTYLGLGALRETAAPDDSGINDGNLTFAFKGLPFKPAWFECYHMAVPGLLPSATVLTVYIGTRLYTVAQVETIADWDPAQPMLLQPAQDLYVCTNIPVGSITDLPSMTAWFRNDSAFS